MIVEQHFPPPASDLLRGLKNSRKPKFKPFLSDYFFKQWHVNKY